MIPLNLHSAICHSVYGLVYDDRSSRLSHYFIDLVSLGADEEGDHSLGNKNDYGEVFSPDFFKDLVNVREQSLAAEVLLVHFFVIDLDSIDIYLNITAIQIRDVQIKVKFDGFNLSSLSHFLEPFALGLQLGQDIVVNKDLKAEYFATLHRSLPRCITHPA